jgi:beta-phosphoglucomutase-like phosphatase (HAD superfamily)
VRTRHVAVIVAAEDVEEEKPAPDCYLRALALLGRGFAAGEVAAIEDTEAGIAAAKDPGLRCIAVLGTLSQARLLGADEIVERLEVPLMERLLG